MKKLKTALEVLDMYITECPDGTFTDKAVSRISAAKTAVLSNQVPEFRYTQINDIIEELANCLIAGGQTELATELLSKAYTQEIPTPQKPENQAAKVLASMRTTTKQLTLQDVKRRN